MRVSRYFQDLRDNFTECLQLNDSDLHQGSLLSPLSSGSTETIIINPQVFDTILNGTFLLAIRAVDSFGNIGQTSNIANVHFTLEGSKQPPIATDEPMAPTASTGAGTWVYIVSSLAIACVCAGAALGVVVHIKKKSTIYHVEMDQHI